MYWLLVSLSIMQYVYVSAMVFHLQTVDVMFLWKYPAGDLHSVSAKVAGNVANNMKNDLVWPEFFPMASWIHHPAQRGPCSTKMASSSRVT